MQAGYRNLGNSYQVGARLRVQDQDGQLVAGATVTVDAQQPDRSTQRLALVTNNLGQLGVSLLSRQRGTYEFCVVDITKAGYSYDPTHNAQTCASVTIR
jgi:hypothetical protein